MLIAVPCRLFDVRLLFIPFRHKRNSIPVSTHVSPYCRRTAFRKCICASVPNSFFLFLFSSFHGSLIFHSGNWNFWHFNTFLLAFVQLKKKRPTTTTEVLSLLIHTAKFFAMSAGVVLRLLSLLFATIKQNYSWLFRTAAAAAVIFVFVENGFLCWLAIAPFARYRCLFSHGWTPMIIVHIPRQWQMYLAMWRILFVNKSLI